MKKENQYIILWKFPQTTVIRCLTNDTTVEIKRGYRSLCYILGLLGWIPAILFKTVYEIHNVFLRILASSACYLGFFLLVLWVFHCYLVKKNESGELIRFIDVDDE